MNNMSQAKTLLDQGQLGPAIEELKREVKANPADTILRTFLFELLCFAGDWDRAEKQLDVIGHQSPQANIGVEVYRNNIKAERDRYCLFSEGVRPHFISEPPSYIALLLTAIAGLRDVSGDIGQALDKVREEAPSLAGKADGRPFQDFEDSDELCGPILEVILQDKYTWLPLEQIKRIEIEAPQNLRDLLWPNARVELHDGTLVEVFLPALYAGSSEHSNDQVKLGRMTEWIQVKPDVSRAVGSKLFLIDDQEKQLFEIKSIEFDKAVTLPSAQDLITGIEQSTPSSNSRSLD
jgi:type VI secretion system protein ImpE